MKKLALGALCIALMGFTAACGDDSGDSSDTTDDIITDDAPDGPPGVTQGVCDVLTQTPCKDTERCTWIVELRDNPQTPEAEPEVGRMGCALAGTIEIGEECVITGPAFPNNDPYPQMGMGAGVADNCVKGAYCRNFSDGRGLCKEICDVNPAGAGNQCGENFSCGRISNTFLVEEAIVAGICEPTCNPVTQRTIATNAEACGSPEPDDPYIGCFPQGSATAPDTFACSRVPREAKGRKDGEVSYGPTDSAGMQTGTYSNGCEAGYRAAYLVEGSTTIAECNGTCAPKDTDNTMPNGSVGDPAALGKWEDEPAPTAGHALCTVSNKGSTRASDCRYQWFLDFDAEGEFLGETQFSDTTGVCFPYSRLKIDPDGAAGPMAPVDYPSCAQMAKYDQPPVAPFDFTAADAGCYSFAFTNALPEDTRQRVMKNAAKLPRMHFPKAEGRTVSRHILL